jgi:hypothetical protein
MITESVLLTLTGNAPRLRRHSASATLFLVVLFHPTLKYRLALLAVFVLIALLGTYLPIHSRFRSKKWTVRVCASWCGALGLVVSIGVFSGVQGWESVWLRFIVEEDSEWAGSREVGLNAAFLIFAIVGIACDWALQKRFGEDPSQVSHFFLDWIRNTASETVWTCLI